MRRSSLFSHLLWAYLKPFPLAFIPALCNQVVGGLPLQWRLAGYSHSPSLLSGPPTRLHFPVFFAEELSGQICDNWVGVMYNTYLPDLCNPLCISYLLFVLQAGWNRDDPQGTLESHTWRWISHNMEDALIPGLWLRREPLDQKHTLWIFIVVSHWDFENYLLQ